MNAPSAILRRKIRIRRKKKYISVGDAAAKQPDIKNAGGIPIAGPHTDARQTDEKQQEAMQSMTLREHLLELRSRLLKAMLAIFLAFLACYGFADTIFEYLVLPLQKVMPEGNTMIFTGIPEGFLVEMYLAFVAGFFMATPVIFYQIWAFIAPGLYKEEKRYIVPIACLSAIFFIAGMAFCYFVAFPFVFQFFMTYSRGIVKAAPTMQQYFSFTIRLLFAFGIIFELPLFCFFLARLGIIKARQMRSCRKYAVVACFIIAAILTPPDVMSQLLMAGPLLLLYEISILVAAVSEKKDSASQPHPAVSI